MSTTLQPPNIQEEFRAPHELVRRRFAWLRRRLRGHLLVTGLTWTWGLALVLAVVSLAIDFPFRLGTAVRVTLAPIAIVGVLVVAYRRLWCPVLAKLDDLDLAVLLERRLPGIGQRVANVLQLPRLVQGQPQASPSMVRAAVAEHAAALDRADLGSVLDDARRRKLAAALSVSVLATIGFCLIAPHTAETWARRWLLGSSVRWPQNTYLSVVGLGDDDVLRVPRGESLVVQVDAEPRFRQIEDGWQLNGRAERLVVAGQMAPTSEIPSQLSIKYDTAEGSSRRGNFTRYEGSRFRYELPPVQEPLEFSVTGGDDWLGPVRVEPIDRPEIENLKIIALHAGHGRKEELTLDDIDGQLRFLPDTQMVLYVTGDMPLEGAQIVAKAGAAPMLERHSDTTYIARWKMTEALAWEILLVGRDGGLSSKPYYLSIGLLEDREPRVSIRSSGVGRRITPQAQVPLSLRVLDDFGVTSAAVELEQSILNIEQPETTTHRVDIELPPSGPDGNALLELDQKTTVAVSQFSLAPGMMLRVRGTATDNCALGSQTGNSRWLTFQIVTPEELFYEILMRQREQRAKFAAALAKARTQAETLDTLAETQQMAGVLRTHQVIARQVWQIANRLDAALEETTLNDLGSPQARQLLRTAIITPMRALYEETMSRQRGVLSAVAVDGQIDEDKLTEARTIQAETVQTMREILNQMAQWESFVDVLNQVRQIMNLQQDVLDTTEELRREKTQDLFDD